MTHNNPKLISLYDKILAVNEQIRRLFELRLHYKQIGGLRIVATPLEQYTH